MTDPSDDPTAQPNSGVGYKHPPKHSQFQKGVSGNSKGRPKRPSGISFKELLDGDQPGKNGEVVSRREAIVIRVMNDAMAGNQKAFAKFLTWLKRSGMLRVEEAPNSKPHIYESRPLTPEEYAEFKRNFGRVVTD